MIIIKKLIKNCLESTCVYVIVNGNPTREFKMKKKGLRQGDSLAHFSFLICCERVGKSNETS